MTHYKKGDIVLYKESPPNWKKLIEFAIWTEEAVLQAKKEWETQVCKATILEVIPEADGEPEQYQIEVDNPEIEERWGGKVYADVSELCPIDSGDCI